MSNESIKNPRTSDNTFAATFKRNCLKQDIVSVFFMKMQKICIFVTH